LPEAPLQACPLVSTLPAVDIVAKITSDYVVSTVTLVQVVPIMTQDTTVVYIIPLIVLLTSLSSMWRKEHLGAVYPVGTPFEFCRSQLPFNSARYKICTD
jgi:hypothetical protein